MFWLPDGRYPPALGSDKLASGGVAVGDPQMRSLIAAACMLIGALAVAPDAVAAQTYRPWCAPNQFGGVICAFDSKEQCTKALSGGGACRENPAPRSRDSSAAPSQPPRESTNREPGYRSWCAPDQYGAINCAFDSQEQCQRSLSGAAGGGCRPNAAPRPAAGTRQPPSAAALASASKPVVGSTGRMLGDDPDATVRSYMQRDGIGPDGVSGASGR